MIRAIELFSCAGGMSEGFRQAGTEFELAIDKDTDACDSYAANLGHRPIEMDVNDYYRLLELGHAPQNIDLIVADPPCVSWSNAGKRQGLADKRDCMLITVAIILLIRPRAYLIANVPGLGDPSMLDAQREILAPLRAAGYCTADFVRLNAANYGVPQIRVRPFWFGHLGNGPCISWPATTHGDAKDTLSLIGSKPWVTCRDALGHLPLAELGKPVRLRWHKDTDHQPSTLNAPARTLTGHTHSDGALLADDGLHALVADNARLSHLEQPALTVMAKDSGAKSNTLLMNPKHPVCEPSKPARTLTARQAGGHAGAEILTWPWDRPSTTVQCQSWISGTGRDGRRGDPQYGVGAVKLSETARAILQGFPEGWTFCGRFQKSRSRQIGMAMPPPMAHAVATSITRWFESD